MEYVVYFFGDFWHFIGLITVLSIIAGRRVVNISWRK